MLTVRVRRWSQAAARLVHPQQVLIGRVHSCYARIINLQTPAGRLLTLQGEGRLQAPLALALATDVEALGAHLPIGALVVQDISAATGYPAALRLRCTAVPVWDGSLPASPRLTPPVLAHIATALATWLSRYAPMRGLAPLARLCRRRVSGGQFRIRPTQPFPRLCTCGLAVPWRCPWYSPRGQEEMGSGT